MKTEKTIMYIVSPENWRVLKKYTLNFVSVLNKIIHTRIVESIITGIVFAVIASLLTSNIISYNERKNKIEQQINSLSNLYIGCNKQWADEQFGAPQFSCNKQNYLFCAYVSDYFVVQFVFDEAQSAQGYLITALKNDENVNIEIDDKTMCYPRKIVLGDISFYDFPTAPMSVYGFVSNGTGRALYAEKYNFTSAGNYYDYYIASLDFGKMNTTFQDFLAAFNMPNGVIDDEVHSNMNNGVQIITNRKRFSPNTYGVSTIDLTDILLTYDWFDS